MAKALYEEVLEEIGNQSLARLGLNIFSFNIDTYEAYAQSVKATNLTAKTYNQHKKNEKFYGYTFETLYSGKENVLNTLFKNKARTYNTDTLADIKYVQDKLRKDPPVNLSQKDKKKLEFVLQNYSYELENFDFSKGELETYAQTNHTTTDVVTIENGRITKKEQLKVIKQTKGLLKDRYLNDENLSFKVPFDDYKRHRTNLEKIIERNKDSSDPKKQEEARRAKIALDKLNSSNLLSRVICENPRLSTAALESAVATSHIVQAGFSEAITAALSALASGVVFEVRDFCDKNGSEASIIERLKRLLKMTIEAFKSKFARGATFGAVDIGVEILGHMVGSFTKTLRQIWKNVRANAKMIFNAIYDYLKGKIKNFSEFLKIVLKGLLSALCVSAVAVAAMELEAYLSTILPGFGWVVASVLAIVAGALAVVISMRGIEMVFDSLFAAFAARDAAKLRSEKIAELVDAYLPAIIENRIALEKAVAQDHTKRKAILDSSFADYKTAFEKGEFDKVYESLNRICHLYGGEIKTKTMNDLKATLEKGEGKLRW